LNEGVRKRAEFLPQQRDLRKKKRGRTNSTVQQETHEGPSTLSHCSGHGPKRKRGRQKKAPEKVSGILWWKRGREGGGML